MKTLGQIMEEILSELSGKTLVGYIKKAPSSTEKIKKVSHHHLHRMTSLRMKDPKMEKPEHKKEYDHIHKETRHIMRKVMNRDKGVNKAYEKLASK